MADIDKNKEAKESYCIYDAKGNKHSMVCLTRDVKINPNITKKKTK